MTVGVRLIRRNPAFAAAVILTLALGIGANTAVFSVINAVLLRPLPFHQADRLLMLWETHPQLPQLQLTVPDLSDWRAATHCFSDIAEYTLQAMNKATLTSQGERLQIQGTMASHRLMPLLGVNPALGRVISKADEDARQRVAMISEGLWRRKFNADPNVIGKPMRCDREAFTIIGVVPSATAFPAWADFWLPISLIEDQLRETRRFHPLEVIARLKPDATETQAQNELQSIARRLAAEYPATNKTIGAMAIPLATQVTGAVRPALLLVWSAVGLVLLIACVNVAQLTLSRATATAREAAIHAALGAGTSRLIRHALVENLTLAVAGGIAGLALAAFITPLLLTLAAGQIPRLESVAIDAPVGIFSFALAVLSGVICGIAPALRSVRVDLKTIVRNGGAGANGGRRRMGSILVVAEIALSLTVLIAAGLLLRSYAAVLQADPGFRSQGVLVADMSSSLDADSFDRFFRDILYPRLRALPGVQDVAAVNSVPASRPPSERSRFATRFGVPGQVYEPGRFPVAQTRWATPEYFSALGIQLKSGRLLNPKDTGYLINETLARRYFPGQDPVGKSILTDVTEPKPVETPIVGVVADVREMGLDAGTEPVLYGVGTGHVLVVHINGATTAESIRRAALEADPNLALGPLRAMDSILADSLARRRFALWLLLGFGALALSLSAVGIYGVTSFAVARRTREMGLRMAIGAQRGQVLRMIMREGATRAAAGILLGVAGGAAISRLMAGMLYGIVATDSMAVAGACALVVGAALIATGIPARRATRIDPLTALREM